MNSKRSTEPITESEVREYFRDPPCGSISDERLTASVDRHEIAYLRASSALACTYLRQCVEQLKDAKDTDAVEIARKDAIGFIDGYGKYASRVLERQNKGMTP